MLKCKNFLACGGLFESIVEKTFVSGMCAGKCHPKGGEKIGVKVAGISKTNKKTCKVGEI